jgi:hypothetical protein
MTRNSYDISYPEYIWLRRGDETLYGCDQDWYKIEWRRRAGCGPVAATNILCYLRKKYGFERIPYLNGNINEALAAMNDVFMYVRPKRRGLHTVRKFVMGMCKFGRDYGISFRYKYILVRPQREFRPTLNEAVSFIMGGLENDVPIAFLNLDAGDVEDQLQSWHWVTVVGMTRTVRTAEAPEAPAQTIVLRYYDQSKSREVDLGRWLSSTSRGGGFAYFCKPAPRRNL